MADTNKSYRIHTTVGDNSNIMVQLDQNYDVLEVLSIKLKDEDTYRLHSSNYGVIVGRVIANGGFGVPNAKISVFIEGNFDDSDVSVMYPYKSTASIGPDGKRYNLLPDEQVDKYHKAVGSFPNKTYLLDNDVLIEVFDKYYKYTTRTNNSGDYLICGVPTGNQTLHMDLDISDCGILSQRPRDFVYKGYTIEQFENPNQFKESDNLESLSQVFSQDQVVNVIPFWGDISEGESIGITRADINIAFKFEPTCVFMGSIVADNASNGISKKCVPTNNMGAMDELTTGEGTIEMIRKTPMGDIEEFQVKGTQLIDGNGVWCYQIPMNLDYVMTDEYGNLVPTDDPDKGIPTRTRVRFRISMHDFEKNTDNYFRAKVLVPHNPQDLKNGHEGYDYEFGSETREDSFRDLFWNNVYTVKSYIPRFQKSKSVKNERFTGIKHCNIYGQNNPLPYNNIRIRLPLMFTIMCALLKAYVWIISILNFFQAAYAWFLWFMSDWAWFFKHDTRQEYINKAKDMTLSTLYEGLCPDLDWFFAPIAGKWARGWATTSNRARTRGAQWLKWLFPLGNIIDTSARDYGTINLLIQTYNFLISDSTVIDENSVDQENRDDDESVCITVNTDYLIACIEMALAQEYKVINFDFYNDWINGVIYMPRWMRHIRPKQTFLFGLIKIKPKTKACMDDSSVFGKTRRYTQQCTLTYKKVNGKPYTSITTAPGCSESKSKQKCHKEGGWNQYAIFGSGKGKFKGNGGTVHEHKTSKDQFVYYFKPCEWSLSGDKKVILFANDIVLLGSLNDCDQYGIPQAFKHLTSSTYIMPTNLALTNMDDDGAAYAGDDGTYCGGKTQSRIDEKEFAKYERQFYDPAKGGERVHPIPLTFSATSHYYSTSTMPIEYGDNDDSIPITEASGIAWNYTGPGQGISGYTPSRRDIYLPGGHFLGISCVNAQTNIKSCINLQRICEAGTTMSQRREVVRAIDGSEPPSVKYRYFVPTGLISNSDIVDGDFRTMFATMNHKRLLCSGDVINRDTGYPIYDFMYLRTNGFNGAFSSYAMLSSSYNSLTNDLNDETSWMRNKFKDFAVADDYDKEEKSQTYRRTIESLNNDYYMFRMGLTDLKADSQDKRFLNVGNNNEVSLPQYENSFYFYFGLKDGSTALDELNKQFFAEVETRSVVKNNPSITYSYEIQECELNANLTINGNFLSTPVNVRVENAVTGEVVLNVRNSNTLKYELEVPFGSYTITMEDSTETTVEKTVDIGLGAIKLVTSDNGFDFRIGTQTNVSLISASGKTDESGYIEFDRNFNVNGIDKTYDVVNANDGIAVLILNKNDARYWVYNNTGNAFNMTDDIASSIGAVRNGGTYQLSTGYDNNGNDIFTNITSIPTNSISVDYLDVNGNTTTMGNSVSVRAYLWNPDCVYVIYVLKYCNGRWSSCNYIKEVSVNGVDGFDLYLGSTILSYNDLLKNYSKTDLISRASDNNVNGWLMRHSMFRQTDDDAEPYENRIFALDKNNKNVRTALFGQPEISNNVYSNGTMKVWYSDDTFAFDGDLSETSIIPTWGPNAKTYNRYDFAEVGVNDSVICSDSLGKYNVESVNTIDNDLSLRSFRLSSAVTKFPTNTSDYPTIPCVAKVNGGTILYTTTDDKQTFRYYGDELSVGDKVKIFPAFMYPVMYRPFYADMSFLTWDTRYLNIVTTNGETSFEVTNGYSWMCDGTVYNGITYPLSGQTGFSSVIINEGEYRDKFPRNVSDCSNETSYVPSTATTIERADTIGVATTGHCINDEVLDGIPYASFSIQEGAPISILTEGETNSSEYDSLNTPYSQSLAKIEGYLLGDFEDNMYCYENDDDDDYVFMNSETTADYYLLNRSYAPFDYTKKSVICGKNGKSAFVYGIFNDTAVDLCELNNKSEQLFIEINKSKEVIFSMFENDEDPQKKRTLKIKGATSLDINKKVDKLTKSVTNFVTYTNKSISGGHIGTKNDISVLDYLNECGISLIITYEFKESTSVTDGIINQINSNNAIPITLNGYGSGVVGDAMNNYFAVGVVTGTTGIKGRMRLIKAYPTVEVLRNFDSGGVSPKLRIKENGITFTKDGGNGTLTVESNLAWNLTFSVFETDRSGWLTLTDSEGNVSTITNGTTISGNKNAEFKLKAAQNTNGEGGDHAAEGYTKKGYLVTAKLEDAENYDMEDSMNIFQEGVDVKIYIRFVGASGQSKAFENSGGQTQIEVVDNTNKNWTLTLTDDAFIKLGPTSTRINDTTASGNTSTTNVSVIAQENTETVEHSAKLKISPYSGITSNQEYEELTISLAAGEEPEPEPDPDPDPPQPPVVVPKDVVVNLSISVQLTAVDSVANGHHCIIGVGDNVKWGKAWGDIKQEGDSVLSSWSGTVKTEITASEVSTQGGVASGKLYLNYSDYKGGKLKITAVYAYDNGPDEMYVSIDGAPYESLLKAFDSDGGSSYLPIVYEYDMPEELPSGEVTITKDLSVQVRGSND